MAARAGPDGSPDDVAPVRWRFGPFTLDELRLELSTAERTLALPRKPLELLRYFLRHAGEVVTKDELLDALWPGRVVSEASLFQAVAQLRQALGPAGTDAVRTIHGYGYRFTADRHAEPLVRPANPVPQTVATLTAGATPPLRPHWRLVQPLGAGGAQVWIGEHAKTRARRVFKFGTDARALAALKREITLYRLLRQTLGERRDFVTVLDWNLEEAPYFVETEYAVGGNLADWIEAQGGFGALDLDTRLALMRDIAIALGDAHAAGIIHEDLKPTNVLMAVDESGRAYPKLADLGSGRVLDADRLRALEITRMGFTVAHVAEESTSGTWLYLAPEVMGGKPQTARSDLYALGVMLYQVVAGDFRRPLTAGWEADVTDELLREDIASVAHVDPSRRLADASELARRLASLDARRAERARARAAIDEARDAKARLASAQTRRRWLGRVAGALVLGFVASVVLYVEARRARSEAETQQARAEEEAKTARAVTEFLTQDVLAGANPLVSPHPGVTVAEVLDAAAAGASVRFADEPRIEGAIRLALGQSYLGLGNLPAAEAELGQAVGLLRGSLGDTHEDTQWARLHLADVLMFQGRLDEAQALLGPAAEAGLQAGNDRVWLHAAGRQAGVERMAGHEDRAAAALGGLLPLAVERLGDGDQVTQELREMLAGALQNLGDNEQAVGLYEDAYRAAVTRFGSTHTATLRPVANFGNALRVAGRLDEALVPLEAALEGYRAALGPEHVQTLWATHLLGVLQIQRQRWPEARELLELAVAGRSRLLGPSHPHTLSSMRQLERLGAAGG